MNAPKSLSEVFARLIASTGPISMMHYMGEANARYYAARDPLGAAGDFVTAPEISQMFGELVGLWLADIWLRAGRPAPVRYIELGPGRGSLARDALRAAAKAGLAPQVHFVEASPALRALQCEAVPEAQWHDDLADVPTDAPVLLVANEFLDALPVRQLVRTTAGWRERMVDWRDGRFLPVAGQVPMDAAVPSARREAEPGTILEACPAQATVVAEVAARLAGHGGVALFFDYGHASFRTGSTLQAVRGHRRVDPFAGPGEADLTAHVDFATLAEVAQAKGARWLGTVEQGAWLRALGIETRAAALAVRAPDRTEDLRAAVARLTHDDQMGALFKTMGLAAPGWPDAAGF
jgi:NADH dehydrogenase [ubiquinone] 1 alpha subcomplex assembly factor 7